jgi:hypothetical protein
MRTMTRRVSLNARMKSSTRLTASVTSRLPSIPTGSGSSAKQEMIVARTSPTKFTNVTRMHMVNITTMTTMDTASRRSSTMR